MTGVQTCALPISWSSKSESCLNSWGVGLVGATSSGSHLLTVKAREVGEGGIIDITSLPQNIVWSNGIGETASAMCMKAVKFQSVVQ